MWLIHMPSVSAVAWMMWIVNCRQKKPPLPLPYLLAVARMPLSGCRFALPVTD